MLEKIGYLPEIIESPDIDESPLPGELPNKTSLRLAVAKAAKVRDLYPEDVVIAADTICAVGRLQLPKALTEDDVRLCLKKISGRRHKVFTGICGMLGERVIAKVGITVVKFKVLSRNDIDEFISDQDQWYGKAGGYTLMGLAASFVIFISGDEVSNVIGLPLYHARNIIKTLGYKKTI
jgi:septum formation protein